MQSEVPFEMKDSQSSRTDIPGGEVGAERAKLRVVIVEDSAIIRARLSEALAEIPNVAIVGEVETEADALAILVQAKWDAAVLDLQLKQGTGLGVLKSLAQGARPANTKIIVFTNYAFPQYRDRSMLLGADYFFDKSREFHRVREVLHTLAAGGSSTSH
jgi:DNA-binding NarL/FixJ family response regulator